MDPQEVERDLTDFLEFATVLETKASATARSAASITTQPVLLQHDESKRRRSCWRWIPRLWQP